jgi:hypothetical protein
MFVITPNRTHPPLLDSRSSDEWIRKELESKLLLAYGSWQGVAACVIPDVIVAE